MSHDYMMNGSEPQGSDLHYDNELYREQLLRALNWYSRNKDGDDAKKYLLSWIKKTYTKEQYQIAESSKLQLVNTIGWLARLVTTGATLDAKNHDKLNEIAQMMVTPAEKQKKAPGASVKSVEAIDNTEEKARAFIGEYLEAAIDNKMDGFDLLPVMKQLNIPVSYLQWINPWLDKKHKEFVFAHGNREESGYVWSKVELRRCATKLAQFITDLESYQKIKKAARKPRATKKKTPTQLVSKLLFLKDFPELKLKSIQPSEIIGASALWVYNTKTRKLGVYRAQDADGLSVKGSTILSFKTDVSIQKTIRKPAEILPQILDAGKVVQRKFLDDIKATEGELNGRINRETILLKVF